MKFALEKYGLATVKEVAEYHGKTTHAVYAWIRKQQLECVAVEGIFLVPLASMHSFTCRRRGAPLKTEAIA